MLKYSSFFLRRSSTVSLFRVGGAISDGVAALLTPPEDCPITYSPEMLDNLSLTLVPKNRALLLDRRERSLLSSFTSFTRIAGSETSGCSVDFSTDTSGLCLRLNSPRPTARTCSSLRCSSFCRESNLDDSPHGDALNKVMRSFLRVCDRSYGFGASSSSSSEVNSSRSSLRRSAPWLFL